MAGRCVVFVFFLLALPPGRAAELQAEPKYPVPSAELQQESMAKVRQQYGIEHAPAVPQRSVAFQMVEDAAKTQDRVLRYALLRSAGQIALQGGDGLQVLRIVDAIDRHYQVDAVQLKALVIEQLFAQSEPTEAIARALVPVLEALLAESIAREQLQTAASLLELARQSARRAKIAALHESVVAAAAELAEIQQAYDELAVPLARENHAKSSGDPQANAVLGRFRAFYKGDWRMGLGHLAAGNDPRLKDLAQRELRGRLDQIEQLAVADGWWAVAQSLEGLPRRRVLIRARQWYEAAERGQEMLESQRPRERINAALNVSVALEIPSRALAESAGGASSRRQMIDRGLAWLADQQRPNGSWTFATLPDPGEMKKETSTATSLVLLTFVRAGHLQQSGKYQPVVKKGLDYLAGRYRVGRNGLDMREGEATMYGHGIAALLLCETLARTGEARLQTPALEAVRFIAYAQDPQGGGWRHEPRQTGNTSIFAWQMQVLSVARQAGIPVPDETLARARGYLDSVEGPSGMTYGYIKPGDGLATTPIGLLGRLQLGQAERPKLAEGIARIAEQGPQNHANYNFYATELIRAHGEGADRWDARLLDLLGRFQESFGPAMGSWHEGFDQQRAGPAAGRLGATCFCLLALTADGSAGQPAAATTSASLAD